MWPRSRTSSSRRAFECADVPTADCRGEAACASEELKSSIARHGMLHPLVVVRSGQVYLVLEGRRRLHAAQDLGMARVPAVVLTLRRNDEEEMARWHVALAAQRGPEARQVALLLNEAVHRGLITADQAAPMRSLGEHAVVEELKRIWTRKQDAAGEASVDAGEGAAAVAAEASAPSTAEPEELADTEASAAVGISAAKGIEAREDEFRALQRLERFFAAVALKGAIDAVEAERVVQLLLKSRQSDPYGFLDWTAALPSHPVQRNALVVCKMCLHMALSLRWTRLQVLRLGIAGLLHNVGLVQLGWKPGIQDRSEPCDPWEEPPAHVDIGARLVHEARAWGLQIQSVCLDHHELWDGSGTPRHKRGEDVDLPARMAALFDHFALLVCPWKGEGLSPHRAFACIEARAGENGAFDPGTFKAFAMHFSRWPVGSVVRLAGGRIARVVAANPSDPGSPRVRILAPDAERDRFEDLGGAAEICEDLSLSWR